jgi:hypothetical protein
MLGLFPAGRGLDHEFGHDSAHSSLATGRSAATAGRHEEGAARGQSSPERPARSHLVGDAEERNYGTGPKLTAGSERAASPSGGRWTETGENSANLPHPERERRVRRAVSIPILLPSLRN